jgi:hypothetical protein
MTNRFADQPPRKIVRMAGLSGWSFFQSGVSVRQTPLKRKGTLYQTFLKRRLNPRRANKAPPTRSAVVPLSGTL